MHDDTTFARVQRVERTGSTNSDLREAARADPEAWPHLSVLVARSQEAGRGRAGRTWVTPPGTALTASVLLRPRVPTDRLAWVTLLGGLAVQRATAELAGVRTGIKWPNDVLALGAGDVGVPGWGTDRKVAGLLAEALPPPAAGDHLARPAVVLGVGVNVAQTELPVAWATSLHLAAARADSDVRPGVEEVLEGVGRHLAALLERWEAADGDAEAAGLAAEVREVCVTLGGEVRAELPGGEVLTGTAAGLDADGHLVVRTAAGERSVQAGDVLHVRTSGA
ncbi:biotin--[acetyl-CoA-carboxylase] ligase [Georgenia sp. AZ-5]|uniref:biotin--[acetyl-CoA-carboxylase] ligase n=1 Tax=Georgenia sp. AZ-5 TaxID=3367526 RepID=UPI0037549DEC